MEKYLVSARKYRPATFASVVGQKALAVTLKNSVASDRLAHAYLFCGSRGVGKTSCARIFAKTINCERRTPDGEACNECDSCRQFNENRSLNIIELDAASNNGVEDMRSLIDQTQIPPVNGRYRVFIVDEVHMLSNEAFNAFLKTLEEPPEYVIFILATTEKHRLIPTILSRCQIYDFNRITIADMVSHLQYVASQEGIEVEPAALNVIARKADGAMRDALSIFDQVAASSMGKITYASTLDNLNELDTAYYGRLLDAIRAGNVTEALLIYKEVRDRGFNDHFFLTGMADYFRDLMVARDPRTLSLVDADPDTQAAMAAAAQRCEPKMLYRAMDLCNTADLNFRTAANKQFLIELTLIKLCQADSLSPDKGEGEGQKLQPIAAPAQPATATAAQSPAATHAPTRTAPPATPATPTPRTAQRPAAGVALGPSISINAKPQHQQQEEAAADDIAAPPAAEAADIKLASPSDAAKAWLDFAAEHPSEHALVSTLRSCTPQATDTPGAFAVTVESPIQQQTLEAILPTLTRYITEKAGAASFTITVAQGDGSPIGWTERELLTHITEENPNMRQLIDKLQLKLE